MYLDFVRINPDTNVEEVRTVEVLELGESKKDKVKVRFIDNNEVEHFYFQTLQNCRKHVHKIEKQKSAISYAIEILNEENRPIHIDELCELILDKGYVLPRCGKTFKNTLSASLYNECCKPNSKVKKVYYAVFARYDWKGEYTKTLSKKVQEDMNKVFK